MKQIRKFFSEEKKTQKCIVKWILDPDAKISISDVKMDVSKELLILIGPEAGFSDEEDAMARDFFFTAVKFGNRILRTETVSTAILAVVNYKLGEL